MVGGVDKIRVLEIIQTTGIGGAETVTYNTARFLDKSRFDVRTLVVGWGELVDRLQEQGVPVDTFIFEHSYNWDLLKLIRRLIKEHKIDIVHTHLSRMNIYGFVGSRFTGAKNVMTIHGLMEFGNFRSKLFYFVFGNCSGKIVAVSGKLAERFAAGTRVRKSKIMAIPNGIDIERFGWPVDRCQVLARFGLPPDAKIALAVGNIRAIKGYEFLIESFGRIVGEEPSLELVICGNDYFDYRRHITPLVEKLRLTERVHFTDFVPDIETLYSVADVYALTSITEGFSLTTVEAMASRAAVIATDCVGPRDIIDDGVDGIIVPRRDPDLYGRTMLALIRDDSRRRRLGEAARAKVEARFSAQKSVRKFEQLFDSLAAR